MPDKTWEVLPPENPRPADGPSPPMRRGRAFAMAFAIAVASDVLSVWLEFIPPIQWALDGATALALFMLLGRQWILLPALVAEAIPGVAVFPTWVLVVLSIAAWGTVTPLSGNPQ